MCVDPGTENMCFNNLSAVSVLHKIPGPIHVDPLDPRKNTQTVERSHGSVKMRLRSGRGVFRHNLQSIMDLEDFISNRTTGDPSSIFKKLGDAAKQYCSIIDNITVRLSNIPFLLADDHIESVQGLTIEKIKSICSGGVYEKSKRFEVLKSEMISTQVFPSTNTIEGEFRAATIHDQSISWNVATHNRSPSNFNLQYLKAICSCKYYMKVTKKREIHVKIYCTHIIGQLRRVIFMN